MSTETTPTNTDQNSSIFDRLLDFAGKGVGVYSDFVNLDRNSEQAEIQQAAANNSLIGNGVNQKQSNLLDGNAISRDDLLTYAGIAILSIGGLLTLSSIIKS